MICVGAPEEPRLKLARKFGAEATVDITELKTPADRIARVRDIVGGFGAKGLRYPCSRSREFRPGCGGPCDIEGLLRRSIGG